MNNEFIEELIPVFILFLLLSFFLLYAYRFLRIRTKRHAATYDTDMSAFTRAVQNEDTKSMLYFGDRIIWNEFLKQSDKKIIYQAVKRREKQNPELQQLWKDVHYKTHGHEPLNPDRKDEEWTAGNTFNTSKNDILDQ